MFVIVNLIIMSVVLLEVEVSLVRSRLSEGNIDDSGNLGVLDE